MKNARNLSEGTRKVLEAIGQAVNLLSENFVIMSIEDPQVIKELHQMEFWIYKKDAEYCITLNGDVVVPEGFKPIKKGG